MDPVVDRLRRRDMDALDLLIERYERRLYRFLLRMAGRPDDADDLFQQTWIQVLEKIGRYDGRREFEPWLFSVARNLAIDYLRRTRPDSLDEPRPSGGMGAEHLASPGASALERLLSGERAAILDRGMQMLPAIYREVLALRFEEAMKLDEISEVLRVPLPTVKSRVARALDLLRRLVIPMLAGEDCHDTQA